MDWEVIVVEPALSWLHSLRHTDRPSLIQISKAITALRQEGPAMGRPLVDTVKGSRLANLKELRPGSSGGSEVRLLFVFDPLRRAVFLVGGDKAGDWHGWYLTAVPRAEKAYEDYLTELEEDTE
ncbi:type II toxin-antitoxin system RelE/ParE family toxin [Streptomyces sp. NPDC096033]|uniref:type II toxin-antitoxin system RelE/ParE family toxin n=1 Tax=Streptomyces sp. NPDC096033 TaxID=3366071 RepID=UPI003814E2E5